MKLIVDIISHIEDNLGEEISVLSISSYSGYSPHHFQKMFAAVVGMSLGTYIRRRRLTKSAQKLVSTNERIIDIAQDSGFDSQEAYTRAFKSMFAMNPKEYRDRSQGPGLRSQPQMSGRFVQHLRNEGISMQPRFEEKGAFQVIGLGRQFERGNTATIGSELWPEFIHRFDEITNRKGKLSERYTTYGVCQEIWIDGHIQDYFRYFAAVEVEKGTIAPQGMMAIEIPAQYYAVFVHKGGIKNLELTNQYIWGTWLPQSGYELAVASDLEVYPPDFDPTNERSSLEIWVPLANFKAKTA